MIEGGNAVRVLKVCLAEREGVEQTRQRDETLINREEEQRSEGSARGRAQVSWIVGNRDAISSLITEEGRDE